MRGILDLRLVGFGTNTLTLVKFRNTLHHMPRQTKDSVLYVRVNDDMHGRLKTLSEDSDIPISQLVRRMIKLSLPACERNGREDRLSLL